MKKYKILCLVSLACLLLTGRVYGEKFYWIGGAQAPIGWNQVVHWGTYSGAPFNGGANYSRLPNSGDTVIFDDNSGFSNANSAARTITLNASGECHDLLFLTDTLVKLIFVMNSGCNMTIAGSLYLQPGMTITSYRTFYFGSSALVEDGNYTITNNGVISSSQNQYIVFQGNSGGGGTWTTVDPFKPYTVTVSNAKWIAADSVAATNIVTFTSGSIDWSGQIVSMMGFKTDTSTIRYLNIENAIVTVNGSNYNSDATWTYRGTGSSLTATNSVLRIQSHDGDASYAYNYTTSVIVNSQHHYNKIITAALGKETVNITTSLEVDTLIIKSNTALTAGITLKVNNHLEAEGCKSVINLYGAAFIDIGAGTVQVSRIALQNISITGNNSAFSYPAIACTDLDGNSGWNFTSGTTFYWVGGSGNWSDTLHWADASRIPGSGCIPSGADNVVFDAISFPTDGTVTISHPSYCHDMTWKGLDAIPPTLTLEQGRYLHIFGSLEWQRGMTVKVGYYVPNSTPATSLIVMRTRDPNATITNNGVVLTKTYASDRYTRNPIVFSGTGTWTVTDSFIVDAPVVFTSGTLVMKGIIASFHAFISNNDYNSRTLDISNSTIYLNDFNVNTASPPATTGYTSWSYTGLNTILLAEGSHLIMNCNGAYYNNSFESGNGYTEDTTNVYGTITFRYPGLIRNYLAADTLIFEEKAMMYFCHNNNANVRVAKVNNYFKADYCHGFKDIIAIYGTNGTAGNQNISFGLNCDIDIMNARITRLSAIGQGSPAAVTNCLLTSATGWTPDTSHNTSYWVGGAGDWNDYMHWADESGGTPGSACVPYIGDSVIFDQNSGFDASSSSVTVTVSAPAYCNDMTWRGMATQDKPVLSLSSTINVSGSIEWQQGMIISGSGTINMQSTDTVSLTNNGVSMPNLTYSSRGQLDVLGDIHVTGKMEMTGSGMLNMPNLKARFGRFNAISGNPKLDIQKSVVEVYSGTSTEVAWDARGISALSAEGSTLILNSSTYNNISTTSLLYDTVIFKRSGTINNTLEINSLFTDGTNITVSLAANITINKHLEMIDCQNVSTFNSSSARTVNMGAGVTIDMDHVLLAYLNFYRPPSSYTVNNCIDGGNNQNINFVNVGSTYYWVNGTGDWSNLNHWATSSGGTGGEGCVPMPGDNVVFDNGSGFNTGADTVFVTTTSYCRDMTWHNMTTDFPCLKVNAAYLNLYGSMTLQRGMSVLFKNNASRIRFLSSGTDSLTFNGVILNIIDTVSPTNYQLEFANTNGTWRLKDSLNITGGVLFSSGNLIMSGINALIGGFISEGSNTRNLDISNSHIRLINYPVRSSRSNYLWIYKGTGLSLNAAGSVLYLAGTAINVTNNLNNTFEGIQAHNYSKIVIEKTSTINSQDVTMDTLILKENATVTLYGMKITVNKHFESLHCSNFNTLADHPNNINTKLLTMGAGATVNISKLNIGIDITGPAITYPAPGSINTDNKTGWDIVSNGKDLYWVGGKGDWGDIQHWAITSGGTPGSGCFPGPSDNVFFDDNSGLSKDTVYIRAAAYCKNMTWHKMDDNAYKPHLRLIGELNIYGSLELQQGMTVTTTANNYSINMLTYDSVTVKSNDVVLNNLSSGNTIVFKGLGAYKIVDNLTLGARMQLTSGRLYINDVIATMSEFTGTGNIERTLDITHGTLNVAGTWNYSGNNSTLFADSSRINMNTTQPFTGIATHTYDTIVYGARGFINSGTVLNTFILRQGFDGTTATFYFPANGTVTINRKIITGGSPCEMVKLTSGTSSTASSTSPANISVPISEYNIDPGNDIGFDVSFAELSYLNIETGEGQAKVRSTEQSREVVLGTLTGNWVIETYTGLKGVSLGDDTTMWCNATFPINTDHFYGDYNTTYLWNDGSTDNHLIITNFGNYWVEVNYSPTCPTSDTIYIDRTDDIELSGEASSAGSQVKISLSLSGESSFDPNPVFVLDSVQPAGAVSGLPLAQESPDFYFSVPVKAFFTHTDALSGCSDTCMVTTSLLAVSDTSLIHDDSMAAVPLLQNDIYFSGEEFCTSITTVLSSSASAKHGIATLLNDTLYYTPNPDWMGLDSVHYVLDVCGDRDTAAVYFITVKDTFEGCLGVTIDMTLPDFSNISYKWYDDPTAGILLNENHIYSVEKGAAEDIQDWWVEATWYGYTFPRFGVHLGDGLTATAAQIAYFSGDTLIATGTNTTLTVHATDEVISPIFDWYEQETGGIAFHTGDSYTTSVLIDDDTTFWVSVSGHNYCQAAERKAVTVHVIPRPDAVDDYHSMLANTTDTIDALANDDRDVSCTDPQIILGSSLFLFGGLVDSGTVAVENGKVVYTPSSNFYGVRIQSYSFKCGAVPSDTAGIHIVVSKPLSQKYYACPNAAVTLGFYPISGVTYNWYDGNGFMITANSISVTKNNTGGIQTWYAEPVYDATTYPKIRVDLLPGDCGETTPSGCALTGTILFKEDFGGNLTTDDDIKPEGIPQVIGYPYLIGTSGGGVYSIRKHGLFNGPHWYQPDDHTYPNDLTRGYLLQVDASTAAGQFYEHRIDNLCSETKLYFSLWLLSVVITPDKHPHKTNQIFLLEDLDSNILAQYYTGDIPDSDIDKSWKQYGFEFTVPDGQSSIVLRIINNGNGSSGNDFVMDDIEIRLCAPQVVLTQPVSRDTTLCEGSSLTFEGNYTDDETFTKGDRKLYARWEHNPTGELNNPSAWHAIAGTEDSIAALMISNTYTNDNVALADSGYYRLVVANADNINSYNCRAMSEMIHLKVIEGITSGVVGDGQTICYNSQPAQLTSTAATGGSQAYTYQWQESTDGGGAWANVTAGTGGTSVDYTPPVLEGTTLYRLITTGGTLPCETDTSNAVTITVDSICAIDDYVTLSCDDMPFTIDVLANDNIHCTSTVELTVLEYSTGSFASVTNGNQIIYTGNLSGLDSLTYQVACGSDTSMATVYLTISASGSVFVDDVWYFGENAQGIRFTHNGAVYTAEDASGKSEVKSHENSLVVSSPYCDGQTIFYSSHNQLYNSLHQPMKNGLFSGNESVADGLAACYIGENKYLFFSVTSDYEDLASNHDIGLKAYVVDMNGDYGKGEVIDSVTIEDASVNMSESIELIASDQPGKYWLVYAFKAYSNYFLRVRSVDVSLPLANMVGGVLSTTSFGITSSSRPYTLKTSPQHNRIAIANGDDESVSVLKFDNTDGTLSNLRTTPSNHRIDGIAYGVEFSPDGNQLYAAGYSTVGGTPMLCQFEIEDNGLIFIDQVQYWSYPNYLGKGGGLKLGPDGKIYVMQAYHTHAGVINNPNAKTADLSTRYVPNGFEFQVEINSYALQFSTGLTKPVVIACNMNNAPIAQADVAAFCVSTDSKAVTVNVLINDTDMDIDDTIYLTSANFVKPTDTAKATLTVNAADSSITLTVNLSEIGTGYEFDILYHIKDNGLPASQCATGSLKITVYPQPELSSALTSSILCSDSTFNYTATSTATGTTFNWSRAAITGIDPPDASGNTANISEVLTNTTSDSITVVYLIEMTTANCSNTDSVKVTVYPNLTPGIIGTSQTYCYSPVMSTIFFGTNPSTGGSGNYTYTWENSIDGNTWLDLVNPVQTYSISGLIAQPTFYRRAVTDNSGCGTVYSDTITIYPLPTVSAGTTALCIDVVTQLSPYTDGFWESSDSTVVDIVNGVEAKGVSSGTATLTYTSTVTGCTETLNVTVEDFPDVAEITGEQVLCPGNDIVLTNATSGGVWTKNNNNVTFSAQTANSITVTGVTEGTTYVTYTVSNGACQTSKTFFLKIVPLSPTPTIIIGISK